MIDEQKHRLDITTRSNIGKVELDGADISAVVRGVTIDLRAGDIPRATLDVLVTELNSSSGEVVVDLPAGSHELLVRLGWTPPPEE